MWHQCDMLFWQGPVDNICIALYICIICWRIHSIYVCKPRSFVMNRPRYRSTMSYSSSKNHFARSHDDVIKWKFFVRYWPFVRGIHRSPVNSPHKGQWRGALVFFFICVWVNNRKAGDLRRYRAHYDIILMWTKYDIRCDNSVTWNEKQQPIISGVTKFYYMSLYPFHGAVNTPLYDQRC